MPTGMPIDRPTGLGSRAHRGSGGRPTLLKGVICTDGGTRELRRRPSRSVSVRSSARGRATTRRRSSRLSVRSASALSIPSYTCPTSGSRTHTSPQAASRKPPRRRAEQVSRIRSSAPPTSCTRPPWPTSAAVKRPGRWYIGCARSSQTSLSPPRFDRRATRTRTRTLSWVTRYAGRACPSSGPDKGPSRLRRPTTRPDPNVDRADQVGTAYRNRGEPPVESE